MILENNVRASSVKRTSHINIIYLFMLDMAKSGEVNINYCPIDDMIGWYLTKLLQGANFRRFKKILNIKISDYVKVPKSDVIPQECVEELLYEWV